MKVYLKNHIDPDQDIEVAREALTEHARLTGLLPQVGKPLVGSTAHKAFPDMPVPYGEVVRVET